MAIDRKKLRRLAEEALVRPTLPWTWYHLAVAQWGNKIDQTFVEAVSPKVIIELLNELDAATES